MKTNMNFQALESKLAPYAMLLLRVVVGVIYFFHGLDKLNNVPGVVGMVTGLGFPAPELFAWLLILTELVGGALLILGLVTRLVSLPILFSALVALFAVHLKNGLFVSKGGYEFVLLLSAALVYFFVKGGGALSLDRLLFKGKM